jgi:hypothetical protein
MIIARALVLALLSGVSCAPTPVVQRTAADIERAEVLPAGYRALGGVRARCVVAPPWGPLDAEPLTRFECQQPVLVRALAEQAVARGGTLLAGMRCRRSFGALSFAATAAGPAEGVAFEAPGASRVAAGDALAFETARCIEVDLAPEAKAFTRRSRRADEVGVQLSVPVSHQSLGSMTARCSKNRCDSEDLRLALRMAAGALGVSDVAEVACGVRRDDAFCVARLAAAKLDPETDPRAR